MNKAERDLKKVNDTIRATRFLGLSVAAIDIDLLERAFDARYDQGRRDGLYLKEAE